MQVFFTSRKSICGLRHFVLIDEFIDKGNNIKFLVSVVDSDVFIKVSEDELHNSCEWEYGFKELSKSQTISCEYQEFKNKRKSCDETPIFLSQRSPFNIS